MTFYDLSLGRSDAHARGWFAQMLHGWVDRLVVKRQERAALTELQGYSDRMLADVGISRGQIEGAVQNGRPADDRPIPYWSR